MDVSRKIMCLHRFFLLFAVFFCPSIVPNHCRKRNTFFKHRNRKPQLNRIFLVEFSIAVTGLYDDYTHLQIEPPQTIHTEIESGLSKTQEHSNSTDHNTKTAIAITAQKKMLQMSFNA